MTATTITTAHAMDSKALAAHDWLGGEAGADAGPDAGPGA